METINRVRAMFYVSAINLNAICGNPTPSRMEVCLSAVYGKQPDTEKYKFWKASPNGGAKIAIGPDEVEKWKAGDCYYLDFERTTEDDPDHFIILEKTERVSTYGEDKGSLAQITVKWYRGGTSEMPWSSVDLSIDNKQVFSFHELGQPYKVTFTKVES